VVNAIEARDMCQIGVQDLASARAAAEALGRRFARVVVTAGEHGVAYSEAGHSASLAAQKVTLVSTHGAGDCFVGVLCQRLSDGATLSAAVHEANQAAAEHVSRLPH
jgi:ribokinase